MPLLLSCFFVCILLTLTTSASFIPTTIASQKRIISRGGRILLSRLHQRQYPSLLTTTTTIMSAAAAAAASSASRISTRRSVGKLHPNSTLFLLCDMQERFRPLIYNSETVIHTCRYMTSVAQALEIPIVATQQYTKVFGPTIPEVFPSEELLESTPIFEKKKFSMLTDECWKHVESLQKRSIVLFGIEAHVCVQQTCLDLLERRRSSSNSNDDDDQYDVHVVVDGVSSQRCHDRQVALERMRSAGAFLTTAQSAAYMLMRSAEHENFKAVSGLTVEHMKLPNEFNEGLLKQQDNNRP